MKKEEINKLHIEFYGKFKKFMFEYNMNFTFSVNTFEKCEMIFSEIGLKKMDDFTEVFFNFNKMWLKKLCKQLDLDCNYTICFNLFELYIYNRIIFNEVSSYCRLCTNPNKFVEYLNNDDVKQVQRAGKYSKKYFYEFSCIDFDIMSILKALDAIRSTLKANGDTTELMNNRDFTISLHKYYSYLSEGISYVG